MHSHFRYTALPQTTTKWAVTNHTAVRSPFGCVFYWTTFIWQQCAVRQYHSDLSDQSAMEIRVYIIKHLIIIIILCEHQASFRAAAAPHSGDWLHALPITLCGLCLDDKSVRVAMGLRLGCNVCVPHACVCGTQVDACSGTHAFVLQTGA